MGRALHKQPWHSRQHHICRHPPVHRHRRPPTAAHPLPPCPAQRAHAPPAPPPPCTPCQRGWVGGALHKQPWHSRQHHICRHPLVHRSRRPPTAAHPLPPAQRSARTRRLLHHHPAHPASEAGWVGHCTSSPGTAGSITSAGTPWSIAVADPRQQRTLSRLPSAARARAACSTTTLHTLPARLGGWGTAQAALAQQAASHLQAPPGAPPLPTPAGSAPSPACPAQGAHAPPAPPPPCTPCQRGWVGGALHKQPRNSLAACRVRTAGGVAAAAASPWLQLQTSCLQSTSSSVTYATREQCQSGLRTRSSALLALPLSAWVAAPPGRRFLSSRKPL